MITSPRLKRARRVLSPSARTSIFFLISIAQISAFGTASDSSFILKQSITGWSRLEYHGERISKSPLGVVRTEVERDKLGRTRVLYTNTGEIMIDDCKHVYLFNPVSKVLQVQHSVQIESLPPLTRFRLIMRNYTLKPLGYSKAAERRCYILKLIPKSNCKRTHIYWIDLSNYCVLRSDVLDHDGAVLSSSRFEEIDFKTPVSPVAFIPHFSAKSVTVSDKTQWYTTLTKLHRAAGFTLITPLRELLGFQFVRAQVVGMGVRKVASLYYTDGLVDISLYELSGAKTVRSGFEKQGFESVCDFLQQDRRYVLLGDIELSGLRKFKAQIDLQQDRKLAHMLNKAFKVRSSQITALRDMGMGYDQIIPALVIHSHSQIAFMTLARMFRSGLNWNSTASSIGVSLKDVSLALHKYLH